MTYTLSIKVSDGIQPYGSPHTPTGKILERHARDAAKSLPQQQPLFTYSQSRSKLHLTAEDLCFGVRKDHGKYEFHPLVSWWTLGAKDGSCNVIIQLSTIPSILSGDLMELVKYLHQVIAACGWQIVQEGFK